MAVPNCQSPAILQAHVLYIVVAPDWPADSLTDRVRLRPALAL